MFHNCIIIVGHEIGDSCCGRIGGRGSSCPSGCVALSTRALGVPVFAFAKFARLGWCFRVGDQCCLQLFTIRFAVARFPASEAYALEGRAFLSGTFALGFAVIGVICRLHMGNSAILQDSM